MNFKRYHVSKNLSPSLDNWAAGFLNYQGVYQSAGSVTREKISDYVPIEPSTTYSFSREDGFPAGSDVAWCAIGFFDANKEFIERPSKTSSTFLTVISSANAKYCRMMYRTYGQTKEPILNAGSDVLPYEPYGNTWHDTPHYIHNTSTDTITTLPAVIYANDTTATVGLKGNTVQSGTPTPDNPIQPQGCGDLETVGAKAGQYKIPILSNSTTTPVYLGEVQTTREIKKLVLDGTESITLGTNNQFLYINNTIKPTMIPIISTHYKPYDNDTSDKTVRQFMSSLVLATVISIRDISYANVADFKSYLAAQYAAGTPVTVWYVLATEETAVVNEPLMKIGNYADTVSNITIPVTAGTNTLSVDTTVQPSEVTATYKGWHPVTDVHERSGGAWD